MKLTRLATLRLFDEWNDRHQEGMKIGRHAFRGFELIDSCNAHRNLLLDDAQRLRLATVGQTALTF